MQTRHRIILLRSIGVRATDNIVLIFQVYMCTTYMYRDSPDEFSVAPVIMKDADCSLVDNLIAKETYLADVSTRCSSHPQGKLSTREQSASFNLYVALHSDVFK